MKRILILSENPLASNFFGTMVRELGYHLKRDNFEIACLAFNYTGWPFRNDVITFPLYPWIGPPNMPHNLQNVVDDYKPDTLLLIGAPVMFGWLEKYEFRKNYKVVLFSPFKSLPLNTMMTSLYDLADAIVLSSQYEKNALKSAGYEEKVTVIPPGISIRSLKQSGSITPTKDMIFRVACISKDIPVIDYPSLLKTFGIVYKKNPVIRFGIFSDGAQLKMWNFKDLLDVYGLTESCMIMKPQPELNFGFNRMGDLYASIDLLVFLHQEDIVNVSAVEASYCNAPMIVPLGGPTEEYLPDSATFLEKSDIFIGPPQNTRYVIFDPEEIAKKIMISFIEQNNKTKDRKRNVNRKLTHLNWKNVAEKWSKLLQ